MKAGLKQRGAISAMDFQSLERRTLMATGTTTVVSAPKSYEFGQVETVKVYVNQTRGIYTPHGQVDLLYNNTATGQHARVDHLGRCAFTFTAGDSLGFGTVAFSARYLGAAGHFVGSKAKPTNVTITQPTHLTTRPDGLQIKTVTPGTGTATVASGDTARFEDIGYASTGEILAESYGHGDGTASIQVDANPEQTIRGLDEALIGMKVGETRVAIIPSSLAYGDGKFYSFVIKLDAIS